MMKNIENCEDLIKLLGKEKVDKLFTEYFMMLIAKSNLYDKVEVNDGEEEG